MQRPTTGADLNARREGTTLAARTVRAFLDAVNAPEALDGTAWSREVVVESGRYTKHEHLLTLGAALLDAGATPGSSLLEALVRSCPAVCLRAALASALTGLYDAGRDAMAAAAGKRLLAALAHAYGLGHLDRADFRIVA